MNRFDRISHCCRAMVWAVAWLVAWSVACPVFSLGFAQDPLPPPVLGLENFPSKPNSLSYPPQAGAVPRGAAQMVPGSLVPHLVIQSPKPRKSSEHGPSQAVARQRSGYQEEVRFSGKYPDPSFSEPSGDGAGAPQRTTPSPVYPWETNHFLHANKTPRPVAIPDAVRVPVWKTPYSYGHFGASRNRQWSLHNGYQRTHTQWTLR